MSANSEILGNFGPKHTIEIDGKVLEASLLTRKAKAAFEKHLFKRARDLAAMEHELGIEVEDIKIEPNPNKAEDKFPWIARLRGDVLRKFPDPKTASGFASSPELVHESCLGLLKDKCLAGEYTLLSACGLAHVNTPAGQMFLATLIFGCNEDTVIKLLTEKPAEAKMLIDLVMAESIPGMRKAAEDQPPNPPAPAK